MTPAKGFRVVSEGRGCGFKFCAGCGTCGPSHTPPAEPAYRVCHMRHPLKHDACDGYKVLICGHGIPLVDELQFVVAAS